jgi:hypothetical protein
VTTDALASIYNYSFQIREIGDTFGYEPEPISGSFTYETISNTIPAASIEGGTWEQFTADSATYDSSLNQVAFHCLDTCQAGHFNPHFQSLFLNLSSGNKITDIGSQTITATYFPPMIYGLELPYEAILTTVPILPTFMLLGSGLILLMGLDRKSSHLEWRMGSNPG